MYVTKQVLAFVLVLICCESFAQKSYLSFGVQTRVTPIYILTEPTVGALGFSNIADDSNPNFTGPGLAIDYQYKLNDGWRLCFGTVVRYDILYRENFGIERPDGSIYLKTQRSFFLDNYLDLKYFWKKEDRNTTKFVGLGLVMAGIGTGYNRTVITEINGVLIPTVTKEHFQFPAVFTSFGWKFKNNLNTEIKMGYCFSNPQRFFNNKFFFPELKVSYDLVKW